MLRKGAWTFFLSTAKERTDLVWCSERYARTLLQKKGRRAGWLRNLLHSDCCIKLKGRAFVSKLGRKLVTKTERPSISNPEILLSHRTNTYAKSRPPKGLLNVRKFSTEY